MQEFVKIWLCFAIRTGCVNEPGLLPNMFKSTLGTETKRKTQNEASRQNSRFEIFWHKAALCDFTFASLSKNELNSSGQFIGHPATVTRT